MVMKKKEVMNTEEIKVSKKEEKKEEEGVNHPHSLLDWYLLPL